MSATKVKPKRQNQINVSSISPEVMRKLSAIAEAEERTLAQLGRIALRFYLEAREKGFVSAGGVNHPKS